MTREIVKAMYKPVHEIVGTDGCLVFSHQDRAEMIALDALSPKRPTPAVV